MEGGSAMPLRYGGRKAEASREAKFMIEKAHRGVLAAGYETFSGEYTLVDAVFGLRARGENGSASFLPMCKFTFACAAILW